MAQKQSKKGSSMHLADQDGHMVNAYRNKDNNSKGWKVLFFNDEVEADDDEHEDYRV